jgi:predicted N-acetyltransferase YhbS
MGAPRNRMTDDLAVRIRPLTRQDVPAALGIQSAAYQEFLREGEAAFASRLDVEPGYCLAATRGGVLVAYLLAHGWPSQSPPPVGAVLTTPSRIDVLFIHDLAVSGAGNGLGLGGTLVTNAFERAVRNGLESAELIAVEGAESYWRTLGFEATEPTAALAHKIVSYGPDARWMTRRI